jgi:hypothetical protein
VWACYRKLILEAVPDDAEVEQRFRAECGRIREAAGGSIGCLLNGLGVLCIFLDQKTNRCTINETRLVMCRLFDCDGHDRDRLVEIGILPPRCWCRRAELDEEVASDLPPGASCGRTRIDPVRPHRFFA